jgi:hypothetical protein
LQNPAFHEVRKEPKNAWILISCWQKGELGKRKWNEQTYMATIAGNLQ